MLKPMIHNHNLTPDQDIQHVLIQTLILSGQCTMLLLLIRDSATRERIEQQLRQVNRNLDELAKQLNINL